MQRMAGDETMLSNPSQYPSTMTEEEDDGDHHQFYFSDERVDHHQTGHFNSLSRLSICTSDSSEDGCIKSVSSHHYQQNHEEEDKESSSAGLSLGCAAAMGMFLSRLSIESCDIGNEADKEASDIDENKERSDLVLGLSPDSDDKGLAPRGGFYSLPATPRHLRRTPTREHLKESVEEHYASDNDLTQKRRAGRARRRRSMKTRHLVEGGGGCCSNRSSQMRKKNGFGNEDDDDLAIGMMSGVDNITARYNNHHSAAASCSAESSEEEHGGDRSSGGSGLLLVIAKPKGGRRSLCMDMEEVKACRDLGFELEHQRMMLDMPQQPSRISSSTCGSPNTQYLESSSPECSSPIASWRISSPGDNPRDVKARLKVWAQAVALASTSWQSS